MKEVSVFLKLQKTCGFGRLAFWLAGLLLILSDGLAAQCNPDITPPVASCKSDATITIGPGGFATLLPADLDDGSYDDCSAVTMQVSDGVNPPQNGLLYGAPGNYVAMLTVTDAAGNVQQCLSSLTVEAACLNDLTPPTAVCVGYTTVSSNLDGPDMTIVEAELLNDGSYDDCTPFVNLKIRATLDPSPTPPATTSVQLVGIGIFNVFLWVGDNAGNWNVCFVEVETKAPKCNPDNGDPSLVAPPDSFLTTTAWLSLGIDWQNAADLNTHFGLPTVWDNCDNGAIQPSASAQMETWLDGTPKKLTRSFITFDAAGNFSTAEQVISVAPDYSFHCPAWRFPGETVSDSMIVSEGVGYLLVSSFSDVFFTAACAPTEVVKNEFTWSVINWFGAPSGLPTLVLPALDLDNDGQIGDAYDVIAIGDSIYLKENGLPTIALGPRAEQYEYLQVRRYNFNDDPANKLKGFVFQDTSLNCTFDAGEPGLGNWKVQAVGQQTGRVYTTFSGPGGVFTMFICAPDTVVSLSLDVPFNYGNGCPTTYEIDIEPGFPTLHGIPVHLDENCPTLSVDIATSRLRPCFEDSYFVNYCNLSDETITGVYLEVSLDSLVEMLNSSLPATDLGNNRWKFDIDTLVAGECGLLEIEFLLDCDAPVGMTHCSEAAIFPDTICGENFGLWAGSDLLATATCDGDSIRFSIKNTGAAMMQPREFVVVEDLIMYMKAPVTLGPGEVKTLAFPADGSFWRVQIPQESGHPFGGTASAFVENCNGFSQPGLPLMYSNNEGSSFLSQFCQENVASFDPNDKLAFPLGYGPDHLIEANTDLEFQIRFQNTGTAPAEKVVVLDTLEATLDAQSVRPGAGSHPFSFEILTGNVLRFSFNDIQLVPKTVDEPASQGFVKFRVSQKADNPVGTLIENRAGIFFDFNAPIITNATAHRIGHNFIASKIDEPRSQFGEVQVWPNPTGETAWLELPVATSNGLFRLTDSTGKMVGEQSFSGKRLQFEAENRLPGLYFFKITTAEGRLFSGKIMLK